MQIVVIVVFAIAVALSGVVGERLYQKDNQIRHGVENDTVIVIPDNR